MRLSTRHLRLWSLIVLATMLYGTLVPGLARAFGEPSAPWAEICSPGGTRLVAVAGPADAAPGEGATATRETCPYCLSGAHAAVVPATPRVALPAPAASIRLPQRAGVDPFSVPARTSAQPRAPPARG